MSTPAPQHPHALPPRSLWTPSAAKRRDTYAITPNAPLLRTEFGFYSLDAWRTQGFPPDAQPESFPPFHLEHPGDHGLWELGWCEPPYLPLFETKILEDRGDTEIEQDFAGRHVLYFKNRRNGFMPEYVNHPVKDLPSWHAHADWRLNPQDPNRFTSLSARMAEAQQSAAQGLMICQHLAGSFMYLRSMIGPEELLYAFYDQPQLIETAMQRWLDLADAVIARHQQFVTLDELFFAEDNCYNHGPLINPDMLKSLLLPYYKELIRRTKSRQLDPSRHLYIQIDTDGDCRPLIPLYIEEIGMDVMSPFEVASGCDVVQIAHQYPNLILRGGIDKRILAQPLSAIDDMLNRLIPPMRKRGGYIPTCDHGVPAEVPYQNYLHFRKRITELST